ncbi:uncharacterized protein LOC134191648 [Corticium candelabrum]|uniref:uncharacterized protein LOC134191648 n=1 Tax=Corticium candelabrum TaxID=121492 RepID=UPI002E2645B6|nr:uncharacterized protein LOC134191648 [Corticium candelabrum]
MINSSWIKSKLRDGLLHDVASVTSFWTPESLHTRRKASVLVPLFESEETVNVLLTKRSMRLSSHKGEVCFPGGKADDSDKDETDTALREANEEVGLTSDVCDVINQLPATVSKHGLLVTPVVALIPSDFEPVLNKEEVETAFAVPLERFLQSEGHTSFIVPYKDGHFLMHSFDYQPPERHESFSVFGLTGYICLVLAIVVFRRMPEFSLDEMDSEKKIDTRLRRILETHVAQQSQL